MLLCKGVGLSSEWFPALQILGETNLYLEIPAKHYQTTGLIEMYALKKLL